MNKKLWFMQTLFNLAVAGAATYMYKMYSDVKFQAQIATADNNDEWESIRALREDLGRLDDRVSEVQADLELQINDAKAGIDRTISASDIMKEKQKMHAEIVTEVIPADMNNEEVKLDETGRSRNTENNA